MSSVFQQLYFDEYYHSIVQSHPNFSKNFGGFEPFIKAVVKVEIEIVYQEIVVIRTYF